MIKHNSSRMLLLAALLAGGAAAQAPSRVAATPAVQAAGDCGPGWQTGSGADLGGGGKGRLMGIAASGPNDAWAVGLLSPQDRPTQTLIEHWTGNEWQVVPSPNVNPPGSRQENLLARVAAIAANNVWAVGATQTGRHVVPLIEHWDGAAWQVVIMPHAPEGASLYDVAGSGPADVWAVGWQSIGGPS
ncbi:MAG TPA: hypothetical protein VM536_05035, partial [Chloroflexia bacterium]|nr:hypothetical protein [Chloroflexia bacterium]